MDPRHKKTFAHQKQQQKPLHICSLNLRKSPLANMALHEYINKEQIDFCFLQEPHVSATGDMLVFARNQIHRKHHRSNSTRSAIVVSLNTLRTLKVEFIENPCTDYFVALKVTPNQTPIYLISIYTPPGKVEIMNENLEHIDSIRNLAATTHSPVLVMGDFNSHSKMWWEPYECQLGRLVVDFLHQSDLVLLNNQTKTFLDANHNPKSLIDLTLANNTAANHIRNWRIDCTYMYTDHRMQRLEYHTGGQTRPNRGIYHRSTWQWAETTANWVDFSNSIDHSALTSIETLQTQLKATTNTADHQKNIEEQVAALKDVLTKAADTSLQKGKGPYDKPKFKDGVLVPWWDKECSELLKDVRWLERRYRNCQLPPLKAFRKGLFITARDEFKQLAMNKRFQYFVDFLTEAGARQPFGNAFRLIKGALTKSQSFSYLEERPHCERPAALQRLLDHHFPNDNPGKDSKVAQATRAKMTHMLEHLEFSNDTKIRTLTMPELDHIIGLLGDRKAPGIDHISSQMIKNCGPLAKQILLNILNLCIEANYFPKEWQEGEVLFILKGLDKDPLLEASYRAITLLPILGKIYERVIKYRIEEFAQRHNIWGLHQFGFLKNRSTIDAAYQIKAAVQSNKSQGKRTSVLALDITGAFDNAWWARILVTMNELRFPAPLIRIISSYFQHRSVSTTYGKYKATKNISKGAPQGSVISPILWVIEFSDLLNMLSSIPRMHFVAFADDLTLVVNDHDPDSLVSRSQNILNEVQTWCTDNKLQLSTTKTQVMLPHSGSNDPKNKLRIAGPDGKLKELNYVGTLKILGIYFAKSMVPCQHMATVVAKVAQIKNRLFVYNRNLYGLSSDKRIVIVHSLIIAMLSYGCEVWFDEKILSQKTTLDRYTSLQHQSLRNAVSGYSTTSYICCESLSHTPYIGYHLLEKKNIYELMNNPQNVSQDETFDLIRSGAPEEHTFSYTALYPLIDIPPPKGLQRNDESDSEEESPEHTEKESTRLERLYRSKQATNLSQDEESALRREWRMAQERQREKDERPNRQSPSFDEYLDTLVPIHIPERSDELHIYTYGLNNGEMSRAAYLIKSDHQQQAFRFPLYVSRKQNEQFALLKALKQVHNRTFDYDYATRINLVTNNRTILSALTRIGTTSELEKSIAKYLRLIGLPVRITIPTNCKTSKQLRVLAREETHSEFAYTKYTKHAARKAAKLYTTKLMDKRFEDTANCTLKGFFRAWSQVPTYLRNNYYLTQLFSGHGAFNEYLNRFKVKNDHGRIYDPQCWCDGGPEQTVSHILLECPLFEDIRAAGHVGNCGESLGEISQLHHYIASQTQLEERFTHQAIIIIERLTAYRTLFETDPTSHRAAPTQAHQNPHPEEEDILPAWLQSPVE